MKNIPDIVKKVASDNGYNSVEFIGEIEGAQVYGMGIIGKNNIPEPIGLPELVLLRNGETQIASGEEALKLLARF